LFKHAAGKEALQGNVVEHVLHHIGLDYFCLSMPLGRKCCKIRYCTRVGLFLFRHAAGKEALQGNVVGHATGKEALKGNIEEYVQYRTRARLTITVPPALVAQLPALVAQCVKGLLPR
jgi:hypothetical protein